MRVAAMDLGSNTFLLLVADVENGKILKVVEDKTSVVRLGQGVHATRSFHPDALARAEECFKEFAATIKKHGADHVVAAATSAARDVKNGKELLALGAKYGIPIEIIDGPTEAKVSYSGAVSDLPQGLQYSVIDVGGGSTEIIGVDDSGKVLGKSVDVGSVRMTEMFLPEHPCRPAAVQRMEDYIREQFRRGEISPLASSGQAVAVAGTPTALVMLEGATEYDETKVHKQTLTTDQMRQWRDKLAGMSVDEREKLNGMPAKRADVLVAGVTILQQACEALNVSSVLVSTRGVRFGLALRNFLTAALFCTVFVFSGRAADAQTFEKAKARIGGKEITIELADTDLKRAKGLMFRSSMPADQGMLFIFDHPQVLSFWMKNTKIPLSIGFFDQDLRLLQVLDMDPPESLMARELKSYRSDRPAKFALEMNRGWFKRNGVKAGATLVLSPGKGSGQKSDAKGP